MGWGSSWGTAWGGGSLSGVIATEVSALLDAVASISANAVVILSAGATLACIANVTAIISGTVTDTTITFFGMSELFAILRDEDLVPTLSVPSVFTLKPITFINNSPTLLKPIVILRKIG